MRESDIKTMSRFGPSPESQGQSIKPGEKAQRNAWKLSGCLFRPPDPTDCPWVSEASGDLIYTG